MTNKRLFSLLSLFLLLLWFSSPQTALSTQPKLPDAPLGSGFTYHGLLKDSSGAPIHNTCDFIFSLWDNLNFGAQIGADSVVNGVDVTYGSFNALVSAGGEFGSLPFDNLNARWLEIEVKCPGDSVYTTLSPRQAITWTPPTHDHWGQNWSGLSGTGLVLDGGDTGIESSGSSYGVEGRSDSTTGTGVYGYNNSSTGFNYGVVGRSDSVTGFGVYGWADSPAGLAYGVVGRSDSTSGRGVYGVVYATTGETYGLYGQSQSTDGIGVYGINTNPSSSSYGYGVVGETIRGTGVLGNATHTSGFAIGVIGVSESTIGIGVVGRAKASTGTTEGVSGVSDSIAGRGVYGLANPSTGETYGVYGESNSTSGGKGVFGLGKIGVYGKSELTSGRGVFGESTATSGDTRGVVGYHHSDTGYGIYGVTYNTSGYTYGVMGESKSTNGRGVRGHASATTGFNIGVYGTTNSPSGYAGYFTGPVYIEGPLTKPGGSFKIDHPLDPENQYLYHSFVESPEMKNVYDGVVILDANGEAWIELPRWFEALNKDFRYQLTPIGASMPDLYIAQGILGNRFLIAGGVPGMQVSWQVTGVRHDPWAEANRIEVEQPKPPEHQGLYLHPELYGQPAEQGIGYEPTPE